jgi:hypothetical protein
MTNEQLLEQNRLSVCKALGISPEPETIKVSKPLEDFIGTAPSLEPIKIPEDSDKVMFTMKDAGIAHKWIKNNPHQALIEAIEAHAKGWFGCDCELNKEAIKRNML